MFVGPDPLDRANCARSVARASAVGHAEVHGHADQCEIEAVEIGQVGRVGAIGRPEQRGHICERTFARFAAELLLGDGAEMRVVHLAAMGAEIALPQPLQFHFVDHSGSPSRAPYSQSYLASRRSGPNARMARSRAAPSGPLIW